MPINQLKDAWDILTAESVSLNVNVNPILKYFENKDRDGKESGKSSDDDSDTINLVPTSG